MSHRTSTPAESEPITQLQADLPTISTDRPAVLGRGGVFDFLNFWSSSTGYVPGGTTTPHPISSTEIPPSPKLFFANERTFLHWLQLCLILGGLSIGLLNFGDPAAQVAGIAFGTITVAFMIYALIRFHMRADAIQQKLRGRMYEEMTGALVLVTVIFLAVGLNFGIKFTQSSPVA